MYLVTFITVCYISACVTWLMNNVKKRLLVNILYSFQICENLTGSNTWVSQWLYVGSSCYSSWQQIWSSRVQPYWQTRNSKHHQETVEMCLHWMQCQVQLAHHISVQRSNESCGSHWLYTASYNCRAQQTKCSEGLCDTMIFTVVIIYIWYCGCYMDISYHCFSTQHYTTERDIHFSPVSITCHLNILPSIIWLNMDYGSLVSP